MTGNGSSEARNPAVTDPDVDQVVCDAALDGNSWWCDLLPHDRTVDHVAFVPFTNIVGATWPWDGPLV